MKPLYLIAIAVICLTACSRKEEECTDPSIAALKFSATTDSVTDDSVHMWKYTRGTNMAQLVYEYDQHLERDGRAVKVIFPANVRAEAYDWMIALYPSGRTYRLKDIHYTDDKVKQPRFHKVLIVCGNQVLYSVNDVTLVYDPGGPLTGVSLPVNY